MVLQELLQALAQTEPVAQVITQTALRERVVLVEHLAQTVLAGYQIFQEQVVLLVLQEPHLQTELLAQVD